MLSSVQNSNNYHNVQFKSNYLKQAKRTLNKPFDYLDSKIEGYCNKLKSPFAQEIYNVYTLVYRVLLVLGLAFGGNAIIPKKYNPDVEINIQNLNKMLDDCSRTMEKHLEMK